MNQIGPESQYSEQLHSTKYRDYGESFDDYCVRYARVTSDNEEHFRHLLDALRNQRILPAGRQQLAVGRPYDITAVNCFVGGTIPDTSEGIMDELKNSMLTLRSGGGCGWDFSTIRPSGDPIHGLGIKAYATGPISFMSCWDTMCKTVLSAGHRRGAMMGVLRVDHPDIMRFINAKSSDGVLTRFNVSVAVTDEFMHCLAAGSSYELTFNGRSYGRINASDVWARIMERNWDWAEPGVLFIDRINKMNPLGYCEKIAATNPCGEQPLPPYGACLLGSVNIVKYINQDDSKNYYLDFDLMELDVASACRAFDNVIDKTKYPLAQQKVEQTNKRRMGIGVTGMANALEVLGHKYGSRGYLIMQDSILRKVRDSAYLASISAAKRLGSFPLFHPERWLSSGFAKTLPPHIQWDIRHYGLRNGLLLSIAPTGTISMCADNVSSGIEPPYAMEYSRTVNMPGGPVEVKMKDYALTKYNVRGATAQEVSAEDHVKVLIGAQQHIDSAVSKTCNVNGAGNTKKLLSNQITFEQFKQLYWMAWEGGAKGCTTFNINGRRFGIMKSSNDESCTINPVTGERSCDQ